MDKVLKPGIKGEKFLVVEPRHLASEVGSGLVDVFSTAMMIAGMEEVCVKAVQPLLRPGETTVGVHVDVAHVAATPKGMKVHFSCELLEVSPNGKCLEFRVSASDEAGVIGEGKHKRVVVDRQKFESKAHAKADSVKNVS